MVEFDLNKTDFYRLSLTEAVLVLDREPNTKRLADWLCELSKTRAVIHSIQLDIAKVAR